MDVQSFRRWGIVLCRERVFLQEFCMEEASVREMEFEQIDGVNRDESL